MIINLTEKSLKGKEALRKMYIHSQSREGKKIAETTLISDDPFTISIKPNISRATRLIPFGKQIVDKALKLELIESQARQSAYSNAVSLIERYKVSEDDIDIIII